MELWEQVQATAVVHLSSVIIRPKHWRFKFTGRAYCGVYVGKKVTSPYDVTCRTCITQLEEDPRSKFLWAVTYGR